MIKILTYLINVNFREELYCLFGVKSKVIIENFNYSTNVKAYVVHCKLLVDVPTEELYTNFPNGLEFLLDWSWKITGMTDELIKVCTIDLL